MWENTDLSLSSGDILDCPLDGDHSLQVEGGDVADRADGDFGFRVLHDLLDRSSVLPNYPPDQVVVCQNFERHFGRFSNISRFFLHDLHMLGLG